MAYFHEKFLHLHKVRQKTFIYLGMQQISNTYKLEIGDLAWDIVWISSSLPMSLLRYSIANNDPLYLTCKTTKKETFEIQNQI